jgi:hypothetical protein
MGRSGTKITETLEKEIRPLEKQPMILSVMENKMMNRESWCGIGWSRVCSHIWQMSLLMALIALALVDLVLWRLCWPALCSPGKKRRLMKQ